MTDPAVTVIVPTHDHAATLPFSLDSVLQQTHADLAVVVIGDGVDDDTRDVAADAMRRDQRVSFVDRPKTPRHGEPIRHEVIGATESSIIAYQGDDDLWLPNHLETMVDLLEDADFAHPLPIQVGADGGLVHFAVDLARDDCVDWHLSAVDRNAISLTGVAHTRASYLRLPFGWRETPPGRWTDHYMWQQYFRLDGLRARTAATSTTVKFASAGRNGWTADRRRAEIAEWSQRLLADDFTETWNAEVNETIRRSAVSHHMTGTFEHARAARLQRDRDDLAEQVEQLEHERSELDARLTSLGDEFSRLAGTNTRLADELLRNEHVSAATKGLLAETARQRDDFRREVEALRATKSWRLTAPLRALQTRWRGRRGRAPGSQRRS